jgi:hypothetical protein
MPPSYGLKYFSALSKIAWRNFVLPTGVGLDHGIAPPFGDYRPDPYNMFMTLDLNNIPVSWDSSTHGACCAIYGNQNIHSWRNRVRNSFSKLGYTVR